MNPSAHEAVGDPSRPAGRPITLEGSVNSWAGSRDGSALTATG